MVNVGGSWGEPWKRNWHALGASPHFIAVAVSVLEQPWLTLLALPPPVPSFGGNFARAYSAPLFLPCLLSLFSFSLLFCSFSESLILFFTAVALFFSFCALVDWIMAMVCGVLGIVGLFFHYLVECGFSLFCFDLVLYVE